MRQIKKADADYVYIASDKVCEAKKKEKNSPLAEK